MATDEPAGRGPLLLQVEAHEAVNYALAHNGMSVLRTVQLANQGASEIAGIRVEARLEAAEPLRLAEPLTWSLPALPPESAVRIPIAPHAWPLSHAALARLDEAVPATLTVTATAPGVPAATASGPLRVLARDEWWAEHPESMVAFVRPRDPQIQALISDAAEVLRQRTGRPDLEGYQSGSQRVLEIAEAIYEAMQAREIRYINPPASFEGTGQKIRPPREVLHDRFGTCLDLAVTYAAALEAAGLNPVLVLCAGHAFAGFHVEDAQLGEISVSDPHLIVNEVDAGLVVPVETTALTQDKGASFGAARQATRGWWTVQVQDLRALIDVRSAHHQIRPLPALQHKADGSVTVVVESRAERELAPPPPPTTVVEGPTARAGVRKRVAYPPRIAAWRNKLLDLSLRNPLLNYRPTRSGLELHVPSGSLPDLEDLVHLGHKLRLVPHDQLAAIHQRAGARSAQDLDADVVADILTGDRAVFVTLPGSTYDSRLRTLRRRAQTLLDESGSNDLYLALGTLLWRDGDRELRAPLFLLPVVLGAARRGQPYTLQIEDGAFVVPNYCLLEKLRLVAGISLPDLEAPEEDKAGIDLARALQGIRATVARAGLPYRVDETAHVSILQFANLRLWQDLGEHWERFLEAPLVRHLVQTPTDSFTDPVAEPAADPTAEAALYCPIPADGSQLEAIRWAAAGRSFVLEGPPGTGKSQTITNLIAHNLAEGRTVLFVAEKQAALDVVKRRLAAVGLGPFCLDIHGKDQSPATVRAQLRTALHHFVETDSSAWEALRARYAALVADLGRYPSSLHDPGPTGMSAWSARQVLLQLAETPDVPVPRAAVSGSVDIGGLRSAAGSLAQSLPAVRPLRRHAWALAGPHQVDRDRVVAAVGDLLAAYDALPAGPVRSLVEGSRDDARLGHLAAWLEGAERGLAPPAAGCEAAQEPLWGVRVDRCVQALDAHRSAFADVLDAFSPSLLGLDLSGLLARSAEVDRKLFKRGKRRALAAELAPHRRAGETELTTLTATLSRLVEWHQSSGRVRQAVLQIPGVRLPDGWFPDAVPSAVDLSAAVAVTRGGSAILGVAPDAAALLDQAGAGTQPAADLATVLRLVAAWQALAGSVAATTETVARWLDGRTLGEAVAGSRGTWTADTRGALLELGRWTRLMTDLDPVQRAGLTELVGVVLDGRVASYDLVDTLAKGLARAVLEERFAAAGLDVFDGPAHDRLVDRFVSTGADVRRDMAAALPARIIAARGLHPQRMIGVAGQLNRELTRQRGGLKIRGLLATYGEIIGRLTPCLLMSPGSVARFLPPDAVGIDVVVFDEASQLRVAESVGAMGRGRSVVVVGDSKQMPPSSFAEVLVDEEPATGDLSVPPDEESVLGECATVMDRLWLSWHYRSRDESLIAFSNQQYYEGRLSSFPGPPGPRGDVGVRFRRVDGVFERGAGRVNRVEAKAIVADVRRRLTAAPGASIGVVTFNTEQRDLILDLLEDSGDAAVEAALVAERDPLFVKNLENVQGDERDVILFSLAFSRDPATGRLPLNFGPLNRVGGERRLNVAVTRAREQVVLLASFAPEDIDLAKTSSVGLAHLRGYLEAAAYGAEALAGARPVPARDRHLDEVSAALDAAGLLVRRGVGLSDFTVDLAVAEREEGPWLAVLLDGPGWARRSTVGDRDGLPRQVLVGAMGWADVERVWLPSWLHEPEAVVGRIRERLSAVGAEGPQLVAGAGREGAEPVRGGGARVGDPSPPAPDPATPDAPPPVQGSDGSPAGTELEQVFRPASEGRLLRVRVPPEGLDRPPVQNAVRQVMGEIIAEEGPVEASRLVRITARRLGWERLRQDRKSHLHLLVPARQTRADALGTFVWPPGVDPSAWPHWRRTPEGVARKLDEVAPQEIANALDHLAETGFGITVNELFRESAAVFGSSRVTAGIRTRLQAVLDREVAAGRLVVEGGIVRSG